jgi:hypothetical protein
MIHKLSQILALLLILVTGAIVSAQEDEDEAKAQKIEFMQKTAYNEFKSIFKTLADLKIEGLERFAQLEVGELKKTRVLAKKAVSEIATRYGGVVIARVKQFYENPRLTPPTFGSTFSINGKPFTFEGEEDEGPFSILTIDTSRRMIRVRVADPRGRSSTMSFGGKELPFQVNEDPNWNKSLGDHEETWKRYRENVQQRSLERMQKAILATLKIELRLSDDTSPQMLEYLKSVCDFESDNTMMTNLIRNMKSTIVFQETPTFLTKTQKAKWLLLKQNPQVLGW